LANSEGSKVASVDVGSIVETIVAAVDRARKCGGDDGGHRPFGGDVVISFYVGEKQSEVTTHSSKKT
jgi:hypothetical protein